MISIFSFSRDVCSGSRLQDLDKDVLMIFRSSSSSTTPKFDREGAPCDSSVGCCETTVSWRELLRYWRIALILFFDLRPIHWLICVLAVVFIIPLKKLIGYAKDYPGIGMILIRPAAVEFHHFSS